MKAMSKAFIKPSPKDKILIGRQEFCDLPQMGVERIRARIDTGAKTSALHAYNIEVIQGENGEDLIAFNTHPENRRRKDAPLAILPFFDRRKVISSNGIPEERFLVKLDIKIGDQMLTTDVTLTSRHKMSFPLLLGRNTLIQGGFVVDVSQGYRLSKK